MEKPRIVVVGSSNTDMVVKLEKLPRPGETVIGGDLIIAAGGKGANQAVASARLGGQVAFIARVGADMFGKQAIQSFQEEGLDIQYVVEDATSPTGVALIFVDREGENSIAVAPGANNKVSEGDVVTAKEKIAAAQVMLLQLETPIETVSSAARLASEEGVEVILNPAPAGQLPDSLLRHITVLTPNESESQLLTGVDVKDVGSAEKAARILLEKGLAIVIITMGAKGAFLVTEDRATLIPTTKIAAVDTTAAGDAFNGALAYALAMEEPLEDAVRFANFAGAFSATKLGAQPSLPTREELLRFRANEGDSQ